MTVRDSITRTGARTPGAEDDPTSKAAHDRVLNPTQCGITEATTTCAKGGHKPNTSRCMPGAGLSRLMRGKVLPYMPAFQPYRGKPAVRNDREGRGNVGIIRSPVRASTLPDCGGRAMKRTSLPLRRQNSVVYRMARCIKRDTKIWPSETGDQNPTSVVTFQKRRPN